MQAAGCKKGPKKRIFCSLESLHKTPSEKVVLEKEPFLLGLRRRRGWGVGGRFQNKDFLIWQRLSKRGTAP